MTGNDSIVKVTFFFEISTHFLLKGGFTLFLTFLWKVAPWNANNSKNGNWIGGNMASSLARVLRKLDWE